jgi:hypothetical protein
MKYNDEMAGLIAIMEAIVGQFYHNEQKRGGFFFRYPVSFMRDGTKYECRGGHIPDLTIEELNSMHYKTGANSLYIGAALFQVLQFLEERYAGKLDFAELEMEYQLSQIRAPFSLFDLFNDNGESDDEDEDYDNDE